MAAPTPGAFSCALVSLALSLGVGAALGAVASADAAPAVVRGCTVVPAPTEPVHTLCPGADLRGVNLAGANLAYAVLPNSRLEGADLTGASLVAAAR